MIDFSRYRPYHAADERRVRWLLADQARQDTAEFLKLQYQFYLVQLQRASYEGYEKAVSMVLDTLDRIQPLLLPDWKPEKREDAVERLRKAWIDTWGDPDTPEVQQRIQETAALLRSHTQGSGNGIR